MNIMVILDKKIFNTISYEYGFNKIVLNDMVLKKDIIFNEENIENDNIWIEFIDNLEDYKQSNFLIHYKNKIYTPFDIKLFNDNEIIKVEIRHFYSSLYECIYMYIYENIPM